MKKINLGNVILVILIIILLISFATEHRNYTIFRTHNKNIIIKNIDRVKDIGTYYDLFKNNIIKPDTIENDSVQKTTEDYEKID